MEGDGEAAVVELFCSPAFFSFDVILQKQAEETRRLIVVFLMVTHCSIASKVKASFSGSSVLRHIASVAKTSTCVWGERDYLKLTVC